MVSASLNGKRVFSFLGLVMGTTLSVYCLACYIQEKQMTEEQNKNKNKIVKTKPSMKSFSYPATAKESQSLLDSGNKKGGKILENDIRDI